MLGVVVGLDNQWWRRILTNMTMQLNDACVPSLNVARPSPAMTTLINDMRAKVQEFEDKVLLQMQEDGLVESLEFDPTDLG